MLRIEIYLTLVLKKKKIECNLRMYEKRSIAPNVEGGESLAFFCAGHSTAGSLFSEEALTNRTWSGKSHAEATQNKSLRGQIKTSRCV